ncbi:ABC-type sugar transport system substrate-binding protein [Bradyrhizobium sp. GM2.4]
MRKFLLAGIAVAMMATPAFAANYRFVIVPKAMNNPFFDFARDGCLKRAKELGNIECIYKGPVEHEPATQAQIIQDFVTQKVDGLAISVADVAAMTKSIDAATAAGIPVINLRRRCAPRQAHRLYRHQQQGVRRRPRQGAPEAAARRRQIRHGFGWSRRQEPRRTR